MMHKNQRYMAIMRALELAGSCSVMDLASRLAVSDETVRRDIKALEAQGQVIRVHGGVVLPGGSAEADFRKRMNQQPEEKRALAALAAAQVRNGDTLMIDSGSTTAYLAQALLGHRDLFVITNGTEIARTLVRGTGNRVHVTGGEVRSDDNGIFGETAISFMRQFRARLAILSIGAVHAKSGFMNFHLQEAEIARCMIEQSLGTMVVADHTKFSNLAPVAVCGFATVSTLVCDRPPPAEMVRQIAENDGIVLSCEPTT
ncbi:DeoR/GlpR family DNA-binding transcription regulator [Acuticoccus sp. MNP-M23]|uniref:DeoR/GlpR family DNA-binding transcription regulator n=1 Tax=Acuticoccus sp. MNP-M23 TaxID=3072793 RepID=UPI0028149B4F|nr:DeoR/GlpR family DNA-binding transcription regulator [Acuticoccus sp. MNP-M23]WMS44600.1 DeoR/GlpR family DNA-binding transcription regulator [Acuticoccus sp. MNP-M23]